MVCKFPSARSLSKARSEGAWRENMAKADKSASTDRYFRPCCATMDITPPEIWTSDPGCTGEFSHSSLRNGKENIEVVIGFAHPPGIAVLSGQFYLHSR